MEDTTLKDTIENAETPGSTEVSESPETAEVPETLEVPEAEETDGPENQKKEKSPEKIIAEKTRPFRLLTANLKEGSRPCFMSSKFWCDSSSRSIPGTVVVLVSL